VHGFGIEPEHGLMVGRQTAYLADYQIVSVPVLAIVRSNILATLFLQQNFGNLLLKPRSASFRPELVLVQNISYGSLDHPEAHSGVILQAPEKGLFEKVCWSTISTV
jgi:hypothetical protein